MRTQKTMPSKIRVVKAQDLKMGFYVIIPQHPAGLLLVHKINGIEEIDDGKWIEITTDDDRKRLVDRNHRLLVLY